MYIRFALDLVFDNLERNFLCSLTSGLIFVMNDALETILWGENDFFVVLKYAGPQT